MSEGFSESIFLEFSKCRECNMGQSGYRESSSKRRKVAIPETVADSSASDSNQGKVVMSGIEMLPSTSESEVSQPGPSKMKIKGPLSTSTPEPGKIRPIISDSELSGVSSLETERRPRRMGQDKEETEPEVPNRSFTITFNDTDDEETGLTMVDDPDDMTFEPEMSINIPKPDDYSEDDDVQYVNMEEEVVDIYYEETDAPEEISVNQEQNRLKSFTDLEENDQMYLVSQKCLLELADHIRLQNCSMKGCNEMIAIDVKSNGSGAILRWICKKNHQCSMWRSQQILPNGVMVGNFKFSAAIVMSGNNYSKVALMAKFLRLGVPSSSVFDRIQGQYIIPEVNRYWLTVKETAQEELRATKIVVAGDGRMDSPGHSAKFCTYTVMNQADKKIVAMEIIDKRETQLKSGQMEVKGFRKTMDDIRGAGVEVTEIVTDAHPQISAIMRKEFPDIRHSWDMWHGAKNLGKKLHAVAMEKGNEKLKPWVQDITNHFFYSAETCNGERDVLQMKFVSVMNHCLNVHRWALGRCDHEDIDENAEREKEWLDADDSSITALEKVIMDPRFQSNIGHYVTCQTTSEIESFNNHLLMYVSKRHAFSYASYKCRCQLAAIDYMHHLNRPLRKNKKGELYYCRTFSKAANHWGFKYVKVPKDYSYIPELMVAIVSAYCKSYKERPLSKKRVHPPDDPRFIASTIAPEAPPPTKQLVEEQQSRLKRESWPKPKIKQVDYGKQD